MILKPETHLSPHYFIPMFVIILSMLITHISAQELLQVQDLLNGHKESLGKPEAIATINSRIVSGTCKFTSRIRSVIQAEGPAVFSSEGNKSLLGFAFGQADYPQENIAYNGKELTAGFVRPGLRSVLGDFLLTHKIVFKEGLISGALSSAWPLLDFSKRNAKLEYVGEKEIDGRSFYVLKYFPKGGSELQIKLFFDKETFRHVRSEYERFINAPMAGSVDLSARQRETRYNMVEEYADFQMENGLNLPHTYKLKLSIMSQRETGNFEWMFKLNKFEFNQPIDPKAFNVNTN
jgi:hypothetical protein